VHNQSHQRAVWLRRAYDPLARNERYRVLVDRVWPRGVSRESLELDEWCREVAPSDALRRWYGHHVERWEESRRCYRDELSRGQPLAALAGLIARARDGRVTLVFGARDALHSQATVLREAIDEEIARSDTSS
jgi:uncharacterized protein YeaO (DUF488 family)